MLETTEVVMINVRLCMTKTRVHDPCSQIGWVLSL